MRVPGTLFVAILAAMLSLSFSAEPPGPSSQCALSPSSIDVSFDTNTNVFPSCTVDGEEVPCPGLSWSASVGSISGGPFSVTHNSGTTAGTGTLSATGPGFSCAIPVTVKAPSTSGGSGGGGSSNTGGASFSTATTVSTTCAGKEGSIKIAYLVPSAPSAIVNAYYTGDGGFKKVFSQAVSSTSTAAFTPPYVGTYELHVSLGVEQTTATFSVPACTGEGQPSVETTVNLQESKELILSKSIDYGKGLSKEFKVYKTKTGSQDSYATEVTLTYSYDGPGTLPSLTITDSVPKSIVSSASQLSFAQTPDSFSSGEAVAFSWDESVISPGQKLRYLYSFNRLVTEQMASRFAAPKVSTGASPLPIISGIGISGGNGDLLASMADFAGVNMPLFLLVVAGVSLLAVVLFLSFVFGSRKKSYGTDKDEKY